MTELAVIEVTKEGFVLKEIAKETTIAEVMIKTEAPLIVDETKNFVFSLRKHRNELRRDAVP